MLFKIIATDDYIDQLINSCTDNNGRNEVLKSDLYYPIYFNALRAMYNVKESNFIQSLWECIECHLAGDTKSHFPQNIK